MNNDKNKRTVNQQEPAKDQQMDQSRSASTQKEPVSNAKEGNTMNTNEKKPYSHKTGDATNFGEKSYRED